MSDLVAEAITEAFGERCPDFEPECHCCKAWAEFDRITTLEAELQKAREVQTNNVSQIARLLRLADDNGLGDAARSALSQDKEARDEAL